MKSGFFAAKVVVKDLSAKEGAESVQIIIVQLKRMLDQFEKMDCKNIDSSINVLLALSNRFTAHTESSNLICMLIEQLQEKGVPPALVDSFQDISRYKSGLNQIKNKFILLRTMDHLYASQKLIDQLWIHKKINTNTVDAFVTHIIKNMLALLNTFIEKNKLTPLPTHDAASLQLLNLLNERLKKLEKFSFETSKNYLKKFMWAIDLYVNKAAEDPLFQHYMQTYLHAVNKELARELLTIANKKQDTIFNPDGKSSEGPMHQVTVEPIKLIYPKKKGR